MGRYRNVALALLAGAATGETAFAQGVQGPELSVEAVTDYRERGLSWSRGAPTVALSGSLPLVDHVALTGQAVALRGSTRADGADLGATLGLRYSGAGAIRFSGGAALRLFPGRDGLHYWEVDARADYDLGPATIGAGISYAPSQHAIGGDNLYLDAGATIALPGKPLVLKAAIGHSSGGRDNPARAVRLRPDGSYVDWRLGAEYRTGPYAVGLRYTDTSIGKAVVPVGLTDRHMGARVAAYIRWDI